jgi:hypothetical protein
VAAGGRLPVRGIGDEKGKEKEKEKEKKEEEEKSSR